MLSHDDWVEVLERQATHIDDLATAIAHAEKAGLSTVFAREVMAEDVREHRKWLARAPFDVLLHLAQTREQSPHI